jgi:hypothetical protein
MTDEIPSWVPVWNRACDTFDIRPGMPPGDAALAALLLCEGMAMNGGLVHAVEGLEADQFSRAVAGYRFFGLHEVADLAEDVARQLAAMDPDDREAAERLELETNDRFYELMGSEEPLVGAFRAHLRAHPEAYAPVVGN